MGWQQGTCHCPHHKQNATAETSNHVTLFHVPGLDPLWQVKPVELLSYSALQQPC